MKEFNTIYDKGALNIFTDASIYHDTKNNFSIGCAGAEIATSILTPFKDSIYNIIIDTTNNNSELLAIKFGISLALKYRNQFQEINLFSDSLISINSLTTWIEGWFFKYINNKNNTDGVLINSSNTPVGNQDIIKEIISLIYYNNLNINFYHQKGHCLNKIEQSKEVFINSNNIKSIVSDNFIKEINYMNDVVDNTSRSYINHYLNNEFNNSIIDNRISNCLSYDITKMSFKKYMYLIGRK